MMRSRLPLVLPLVLCALLLPDRSAVAQGYVHLPNGGLGYITDLTTTGFFECGNPRFTLGSCSVAGNVMTLGHGGSSITFTFNGLSQTITAGKTQRVKMGSITKSYSGPAPHTFPATTSRHSWMFYFTIVLNTTLPLPATDGFSRGYAGTSPTTLHPKNFRGLSNYAKLPVTQAPAPFDYHEILFWDFTPSTFTAGPDSIEIFANVSLTPEPATIWLTGSGLLGLLAVAKRRRRSRERSAS
jgi:PEP-CTERM motif